MGRIAIIGSGLAGLLTGILLSRRGHTVTILEKDVDELSSHVRGPWVRQGVGQASQTHAFLALSSEVLRDDAPDVLALLEERCFVDRTSQLDDGTETRPAPRTLFDGRLAFEQVLREVARLEPLLDLELGLTATSLRADVGDSAPHVRGVMCRCDIGEEYRYSDLVIDASGRKSQASRMLREIGARPMREEVHQCDFQYLTRWYRLNEGEEFPNGGVWVRGRSAFGGFLLCPAGDRQFSLSYTMSVHDPLRHILRKSQAFDEFAQSVPRLAEWLDRARGAADPVPFGGIENRRRELVDGHGPIVTGLALVGDSAMHTNPTLGRGTSLAFKQAQFVARNVDEALVDPHAFAVNHARWLREEIGFWFDSQVAQDAELCDRLRALAKGEPLPPLSSQGRAGVALQNLAECDPMVAREAARMIQMLARPADVFGNEVIRTKVMNFLAAHPDLDEVREGRSRASMTTACVDPASKL